MRELHIGRRLRVEGPDLDRDINPFTLWSGHACDEYGNCSVYVKWAPLGGFVFFWEPASHFQHQVELPDPGIDPWIDQRYYRTGD